MLDAKYMTYRQRTVALDDKVIAMQRPGVILILCIVINPTVRIGRSTSSIPPIRAFLRPVADDLLVNHFITVLFMFLSLPLVILASSLMQFLLIYRYEINNLLTICFQLLIA